MDKYSEHEDEDIVVEDKQISDIENITDEEELQAAKELLLEDIEKEENKSVETSQPLKKEEDNLSDEALEAKKKEAQSDDSKKADAVSTEKKADEKFTVTDEFIATQPEDVKALLNNFKGKGSADLAKAAAHAIALKNPYLKDDEKVIAAMTEKFEKYTNDDLLKTFIETQKETGKSGQEQSSSQKSPVIETIEKIEQKKDVSLPPIEETEEIKAIIDKQVHNNLKKYYEDVPEDMNSVEGREWKRDKAAEDPEKFDEFLQAKKVITSEIKSDLQKITYFQNNHKEINNSRYESEVDVIKNQLKTLGLTEKDLSIDLTLTKDSEGLDYNDTLNSLMREGESLDGNLLGAIGDKVFLKVNKDKRGLTPLAKKFLSEYSLDIASAIARRQVSDDKKEIERLKDENLNSLGDRKTGGKTPELLTAESIEKITDEELLKRKKRELESSFD